LDLIFRSIYFGLTVDSGRWFRTGVLVQSIEEERSSFPELWCAIVRKKADFSSNSLKDVLYDTDF